MSATYLHGVETIEINNGARSITVVKSAVIGLIGISPLGEANVPILVTSDRDAAQFGNKVPGFSIPQSLDAIFNQGAGTVIVINVFNPSTHTTQVNAEAGTIVDGILKLAFPPIGDVTITSSTGDAVTYVKGTDYSIDEFGNFIVLSNTIANNTALKFSYKKLNESAITPATIIGSVDAGTGNRTGMKCWDLAKNLFGINPKILIAPTFSSLSAISVELIFYANKYRAITYIDAPFGTTVANAIAGRGPSGTINFNTSSNRAELLFPELKWYDEASDTNVNFPYSAFKAGMRAAIDNSEGFWVSDSNHEILGIVGSEINISAAVNDASTDANMLNSVGITTVFNSFGTGIRTWGNRSASFPSSSSIDNFVCVRRTKDILDESIELAALQYSDRPITQAWIDTVREDVNAFIRVLQGKGALIDGSCKFIKSDNPTSELQQGHVTFFVDCCPPPPAERITFNSFINVAYLNTLK